MDASKTFKTAKDIVARRNQDGTFIIMKLDESSFFYKIDGIAAEVWSKLANPCSLGQLNSELFTKYPQFTTQLESDISNFVNQLLEKNLIFEC